MAWRIVLRSPDMNLSVDPWINGCVYEGVFKGWWVMFEVTICGFDLSSHHLPNHAKPKPNKETTKRRPHTALAHSE